MRQIFYSVKSSLQISLTLFGTIVGAGFLSGAELIRFFPDRYFVPYALYAAGLFFFAFFLLLHCGKKWNGFEGTVSALFGRAEKIVKGFVFGCSFVLCAAMLAGLSAVAREGFFLGDFSFLVPIAAAAVLYVLSYRGVKGVFWTNALLVPVIFFFIAFFAGDGEYFPQTEAAPSFLRSIFAVTLYVSMNVFLAAPLVCDIGARSEGKSGGSTIASLLIGFCICAVLACIAASPNSSAAQLPFLAAVGQKSVIRILFSCVCVCGIMTTLFSSYYPLHNAVNRYKRAPLWRAAMCMAAFLISLFGLKNIVGVLYPMIGLAGAIFLVRCVVGIMKKRQTDRCPSVQMAGK